MHKKIALIILSLFIIVIFSFVILRAWSLGSEDNYFNSRLRSRISAWPFARKIMAFHFDGDAKADYLGSRYNTIELEVDAFEGYSIPEEGLNSVVAAIEQVTGKEVFVRHSDYRIPNNGPATWEELKTIVTEKRSPADRRNASLYLLLASSKGQAATNIGETFGEDGIIIYVDGLKSFLSGNPELFQAYFASTVLHEFGHQLGLSHNDKPGCLMNPEVEGGASWETPEDVISRFCPYELELLKLVFDN